MTTTIHPGLDRIVATLADLPDVAQAQADFAVAQLRYDMAVSTQSQLPESGAWPTPAQQGQLAYDVAWAQARLLEAWGTMCAAMALDQLEQAAD